ncbi:MAG TPA: hypothetical protein P5509_05425 [Bacteroidales bacterium]|nr:hypothetical protein [Bacteroidales bacterium]
MKRRIPLFEDFKVNEELLGHFDIPTWLGKIINVYVEIYKNPKTVKRMAPNCRAISDAEGNLYVMDIYGVLIHADLIAWVFSKGYIKGKEEKTSETYNNFHQYITWTKDGKSNTFKLGESNSEVVIVKHKDKFLKSFDAVVKKNPSIKFELEVISRNNDTRPVVPLKDQLGR